jgi:primosomal protein N''
MTPKEKAIELVDKYYWIFGDGYLGEQHIQCALIAVEEVRWFHERLFHLTKGSLFDKYLNEVKQEIEKL